jgi:mannose-6-phosphate isomerase-like protein (cupin superfamily)
MLLHHKTDAAPFTIPGGTVGALYPPGPKAAFSVAVVESRGRYPESGVSVNDVCTESIYVESGELTVTVDGEEHVLAEGDMLCIEPGEHYSITGTGRCIDIITPAWDSKQNHIIK